MIVVMQPFTRICLQHVDAVVALFAARNLIELLKNGLVEALATSRDIASQCTAGQRMPFVCGDVTLVLVWSMSLMARKSWSSCLSTRPQYSVPRWS